MQEQPLSSESRWLRLRLLGAAVTSLMIAACADENALPRLATYPVQGRVLLASGRPLTTGRVYFHRQEVPPIRVAGEIGPSGQFALSTRAPGDGAPAGHYRVQIDPAPSNVAGPAPRVRIPRIPQKYLDDNGGALTVTVQAGPNELEPFRLK